MVSALEWCGKSHSGSWNTSVPDEPSILRALSIDQTHQLGMAVNTDVVSSFRRPRRDDRTRFPPSVAFLTAYDITVKSLSVEVGQVAAHRFADETRGLLYVDDTRALTGNFQ